MFRKLRRQLQVLRKDIARRESEIRRLQENMEEHPAEMRLRIAKEEHGIEIDRKAIAVILALLNPGGAGAGGGVGGTLLGGGSGIVGGRSGGAGGGNLSAGGSGGGGSAGGGTRERLPEEGSGAGGIGGVAAAEGGHTAGGGSTGGVSAKVLNAGAHAASLPPETVTGAAPAGAGVNANGAAAGASAGCTPDRMAAGLCAGVPAAGNSPCSGPGKCFVCQPEGSCSPVTADGGGGVGPIVSGTDVTCDASGYCTGVVCDASNRCIPVCVPQNLPMTVHAGSRFDWRLEAPDFYCHGGGDAYAQCLADSPKVYCAYFQNKADIDAFFPWPDKVMDYYVGAFGGSVPRARFVLMPPADGYVYGSAFPQGFGASEDVFWGRQNGVKGYLGYLFAAHEGANFYTGQSVSGGWPCDWWADGGVSDACKAVNPTFRSPAPASMADLAMGDLDWRDSKAAAQVHHALNEGDGWFVAFRDGYLGQYGAAALKSAFDLMRGNGVRWDSVGANPSAERTNWVVAYLCAGAGTTAPAIAFQGAGIPGIDLGAVNRDLSTLSSGSTSSCMPNGGWCGTLPCCSGASCVFGLCLGAPGGGGGGQTCAPLGGYCGWGGLPCCGTMNCSWGWCAKGG